MSGTNHAVGSLGTIGGLMTLGRMFGLGGGAAGGLGGMLGGAGGAMGGLGAVLGAAALPLGFGAAAFAGLQLGGGVLHSMGIKNLFGLGGGNNAQIAELQKALSDKSLSASTRSHLQHVIHLIDQGQSYSQSQINQMVGPHGGATSPVSASTTQNRTGGTNQAGGISGSAKSAVGAAESQVGVPYLWGGEQPGVGFDCSGLIQWAYKQAGINLPRTSQAMWDALKGRRVPLNQVQEGDLIFQAGSDGTTSSPGHVGMMVSGKQLIQAPYTGANVQVVGYNSGQWLYAARPSGKGSFVSGGPGGGPQVGGTASSMAMGNRGLAIGPGTNQYGSANEVDLIAAMGSAGGSGFGLTGGTGNNGSSGSGNTISSSTGNTKTPTNAAGIVAAAKKIAAQYGWASGIQWNDFVNVVNAESGWNVHAQNASGAYGIPQALPGSKMASAGKDWQNNPMTQLKWMFGYIKGRWGTPAAAWQNEQQYHWYGTGGMVQPGLSIVGERGPELMMTSGGKSQVFSNAQTMALINSIKGNAPQNPWKTDVTSGGYGSSSSSSCINVNFNAGSIVIHSSAGTSTGQLASKAGREVARQVVRHLNDESVHHAIRQGDKL